MNNQERYEDAVRRLLECCYEVVSDEHGYIVRHLMDRDDVSRASNLDELVELADLMEWAEQRRLSRSERQLK